MAINKRILLSASLALLLLPFCNQATTDATSKDGDGALAKNADTPLSEIDWVQQDYTAALAKAETDGKLLMIDVYTDWCMPCKKMDKETFHEKNVVDKAANFVTLKLDAEKGQGPEVQKKFGVTGYPTILFVNGKGELVHSVLGYQDGAAFISEMDKALDKKS